MPARLFLCVAFCCALVSSAYAQRANRDRARESLAPQLLGKAGEAKENAESDEHVPIVVLSASERQNYARAVAALSNQVRCDFKETELKTAVAQLSKQTGLPIELDQKSLEESTIGLDTQVTYFSEACSLRHALDGIARPYGLTWIPRGAGILVTTKEAVDSKPQYRDVVVYPVGDLIGFPGARPSEYDFDSLIDVITSTLRPDSWKDSGTGEGTIGPFANSASIIVDQQFQVHEQLASLLESLRAAKAQQTARGLIRDEGPSEREPIPAPRVRNTRERTRWGKPVPMWSPAPRGSIVPVVG